MLGKNTVRRCSVYFSAVNDVGAVVVAQLHPLRRRGPRASTVREPSTVSDSVVVICE